MENEIFAFIEAYMSLSDLEKQALIDLALFRQYQKGAVILKEGDRSNESYFVLKGCLSEHP